MTYSRWLKRALLQGILMSVFLSGSPGWAKNPDLCPFMPQEKNAKGTTGTTEEWKNPYCRPKLKALKNEIRKAKPAGNEASPEQVFRLFDLFEDLKTTRQLCGVNKTYKDAETDTQEE